MRKKLIFTVFIVITLLISGCVTNEEEQPKDTGEDVEETSFPVTIEWENEEIVIQEKPENILPLSLEVAEIVLELVNPEKIPAVTKGIDDPYLSTQTDVSDAIPNRIGAAVHIDPEEIIAYDTDLLLMTKMYGQEKEAEQILRQLDTPILSFDPFVTVEQFFEGVSIIGQAVGEEEKAEEIITNMRTNIKAIQENIPEDESPTVLVLSEVGGDMEPFMMGPTNISYDLIKLAGATPAVDAINLERSTPAEIEQILKMDPEYIFLLDFYGKGEEGFENLMEDPGWSTLQAVEKDRVKVVEAKYILNPNVEIVEGLKIITDWIYSLEDES